MYELFSIILRLMKNILALSFINRQIGNRQIDDIHALSPIILHLMRNILALLVISSVALLLGNVLAVLLVTENRYFWVIVFLFLAQNSNCNM